MLKRFRASFAAVSLIAGVVLLPAPGFAAVPLGGLTVAVSPAGDKLVAGGDTRTLLVLDPETLAVKERIWIETSIVSLTFDKTGATLAVTDTSGEVLLFDTSNWKQRAAIPARGTLAYAPESGFVAGSDKQNKSVSLFSMSDGKETGKLALPAGAVVANLGFSADGKRLAVILKAKDGSEPKVAQNAIPKELKGLAREEFVLRNDGKISELLVFDAASGKMMSQAASYYSLDNDAVVYFDGDAVLSVNYRNINARISPDGNAALFATPNGFNYGTGVSPDQKLLLSGGLRSFSVTKPDGSTHAKGELPRLPGWPEYFKGFSATADGKTIYGATTAYRIVKIGPDGKIVAVAPVK
jgi:WD40 repeat protein